MTDTLQKPLRKGEQTRASILDAALDMASRDGLEGLTIGSLAERMGMSKSGVFAHFGSREDLQIDVLKLYHHQFEQEVFYPSIREPRGLPRLVVGALASDMGPQAIEQAQHAVHALVAGLEHAEGVLEAAGGRRHQPGQVHGLGHDRGSHTLRYCAVCGRCGGAGRRDGVPKLTKVSATSSAARASRGE